MSSSATLPRIAWMHCPGTIACRADSNLETIEYFGCPGASSRFLTLDEVLTAVPEVNKVVQCIETYEPGCEIGNAKGLLKATKWLKSLDPELPVVITHGTNNLHDIAFFLDVTLDRPGPIVLTGSMRPLSALSADSHYNLVQSCALAIHPCSRNRGVMILLSDRITPAFYGLKTSANRMDTFKCFEAGHLGLMNNLTPHFFYEPAQPTGKPYFEISDLADLPKVAIFVCHMDMDLSELEKKLDDDDIKGFVIAGFGSATIPPAWESKAAEVGARGFPIVRTSLQADSHITPSYYTRNQIAAGDLGPSKSHTLLRLAIARHGQDIKKIRQAFGTDFEPTPVPR